jgi:hypothetical protein
MALLGLDCVIVLITFFLSFKLSAPFSLSHKLVNGLKFVLPLNSKELAGLEPPKHKRKKKNRASVSTQPLTTPPALPSARVFQQKFAARIRQSVTQWTVRP